MNKILILFFLIGSIANAQNPYEQFGFDNTELETEMEKLKSNNFILVNTDSTSNISALKFDFNVGKVIIVYNNGFVEEKLIPKEMVLRWLSVDPKADQFPHQSPYISMDGNPINKVDPNGESTITANDGTVREVNNDNDLGVYKSDLKVGEYGPIQDVKNLEKMGETFYIDEFLEHDNITGKKLPSVQKNIKINFGSQWDDVLKKYNNVAKDYTFGVISIAIESLNSGEQDIKTNPKYSNQGRL